VTSQPPSLPTSFLPSSPFRKIQSRVLPPAVFNPNSKTLVLDSGDRPSRGVALQPKSLFRRGASFTGERRFFLSTLSRSCSHISIDGHLSPPFCVPFFFIPPPPPQPPSSTPGQIVLLSAKTFSFSSSEHGAELPMFTLNCFFLVDVPSPRRFPEVLPASINGPFNLEFNPPLSLQGKAINCNFSS